MKPSEYAERGDCPGLWWCNEAENAASRPERVALCTKCWEEWLAKRSATETSKTVSYL